MRTAQRRQKKAATTTKVPDNETPRQRFLRIAEPRINHALHTIAILRSLSDRKRYEYSERDVTLMRSRLLAQIDLILTQFEPEEAVIAARPFSFAAGDDGPPLRVGALEDA